MGRNGGFNDLLDNGDDFVGTKKCFNDDDCKLYGLTCNFYNGNTVTRNNWN